jgi:hypothetical protein
VHSSWEKTALQKAADQAMVRSTLKGSGIFATIFGVLALFGAIQTPLDPLLLAVGIMLTLVGLWNLTNPSPVGLLFMAITLAAVGLYNVATVFIDAAAGEKPMSIWAVLGVWQVIWGIQGFNRWKRLRHTFETAVDDAARKQARAMIDELRKTNPKKSADVIEYMTGGLSPRAYRARLQADFAFVLAGADDQAYVLTRDEFAIDADGEAKKMRKVKIRMGAENVSGSIPAESFDRFQNWKRTAPLVQQRAA